MKKNFYILLVLVLTNLSFITKADFKSIKDETTKSVNEFVNTHPDLNAVYEFKKGKKQILNSASGYFSIDKNIKLEPKQEMLIASGTKNIIAAAILHLEEKGMLKVSDSIDKFFPNTADTWKAKGYNGTRYPDWADKVTIHNLLTHTSGIKEYVFNMKIDPTQTHDEINKHIIHFAASNPLAFTPGEKYEYCNTGYVILGMIIENLTQKNLSQYLKETFFIPLKMKNTHMASLHEAVEYSHGTLDKYPDLYFAFYKNDKFEWKRAETNFFFVPYADGGIITTTDDLVNWHYNLHHGKILKKAAYHKMITPHIDMPIKYGIKSHYGYGIVITKLSEKDTLYGHAGNAAGIRSESGYIPSLDLGFAILSNVMPIIDPNQLASMDMSKSSNQLDIFFLLDRVLKDVVMHSLQSKIAKSASN